MAKQFFEILFIFVVVVFQRMNGSSDMDLDAVDSALRSKGYNLFANAITTTDLRHEILEGHVFTLFAPTDSTLFALQMNVSPDVWIRTLRYHIAPRYFTYASLGALPAGSFLPTLLPGQDLLLAYAVPDRRPGKALDADFLTIEGVDIVVPGIFYSRSVAVHGLDGVFDVNLPLAAHQDGIASHIENRYGGVSRFRPKITGPAHPPESRPYDGGSAASPSPIRSTSFSDDRDRMHSLTPRSARSGWSTVSPSAAPAVLSIPLTCNNVGRHHEAPAMSGVRETDRDVVVSYAGPGEDEVRPRLSIGFD